MCALNRESMIMFTVKCKLLGKFGLKLNQQQEIPSKHPNLCWKMQPKNDTFANENHEFWPKNEVFWGNFIEMNIQ